jgi:hypothetical protein
MKETSTTKSNYQQLVDNWADTYRVDAEFIGYLVSELEKGVKLTEADIFQRYFEIRTLSRTNESTQLLSSSDPKVHAIGKQNLMDLEPTDLTIFKNKANQKINISLIGEHPRYVHLQALTDVRRDLGRITKVLEADDIGQLVMERWYPSFDELIAEYRKEAVLQRPEKY